MPFAFDSVAFEHWNPFGLPKQMAQSEQMLRTRKVSPKEFKGRVLLLLMCTVVEERR